MMNRAKLVAAFKDTKTLASGGLEHTPHLSQAYSTPSQIAEAEEQLVAIVDEIEYRLSMMKEALCGN